MPRPSRMPLTAMLPKGPASKMAGGRLASGPVMAGVESAVGAAGGGVAGAACAAAASGGAGAGEGVCARAHVVMKTARRIKGNRITGTCLFGGIPSNLLSSYDGEEADRHFEIGGETVHPAAQTGGITGVLLSWPL